MDDYNLNLKNTMKTNILLVLFAFAKMLLHFGGVNCMEISTVEVGTDNSLNLIETVSSLTSDEEFNFGTRWSDFCTLGELRCEGFRRGGYELPKDGNDYMAGFD